MASSARLVTIKRSGDDGAHFPLSLSSCLFGRSIECDIRIQLPVVSKRHCKIEVKEHEAILYNFSSTNPTQVNGAVIDEPVQLRHGDIITIIDRSFRYESGSHEAGSRPTEFPGKSLGKEPSRRTSRDSFCADPDAKGQDTKVSKMTASRRSFVQAKGLSADSPASGGSKDSVSQDSSGHVEQRNRRNIDEPTSGDLFKKSRATGSSYRELKSSPAQSLSNSNKKESPFEKLYQSMKEELNVKSQKSCRKSEPPSDRATEESWETQLLVSCKARPKSSGSTPVIPTSSPKVGKIWTERRSGGKGPAQTSTETAKTKTPVQNSQQLKDEDFRVTGRRNSVNLDDGEGAEAVHKIVTPGKLVTRNQTAVKVGDVASPADTPENSSSKKRRSIPAKVPSAETQKRLSLTQRLAPDEKKSPKNSFSKTEKLATAAEQTCSVLPGLSSVDISNFGDSIHESEGMPSKRRRVSFGGHLKPELFDENLPPNTPLKRGETPAKRKSVGSHSPAVLKKIIKEKPQSPGKQESSGVTPPRINDQRRRSGRTSLASSGSKFLCETDIPKKAGRKSGSLPAKRASISRSQHGILQMICSKRRSGASEANLIVAKSWADVVKLGVKQTQMKVVKPVPQKQASKRQRRPSTPQKPTRNLHNQFTTGHANSPCTIVVGRAQLEKVNVPARPYKMLNNLMLNRKVDFSEDLSGLTEMFKTPVKEKQQQMSDMGSVLSNSENLSEKQLQVTTSGDTPLPITSEILEEKVLSITQNTAKQQSDRYSASPTLRRRSIKHENTVQAPNIIHLEKKTPVSETELLKTASSMSKLKRSRELRHTLVGSVNEKPEAVLTEIISGRHLKKTFRGQEVDQQVQDSENSSQRCKENGELSEGTEKTSARRLSARKEKPTKDLIESQIVTQTADCAEELLSQEQGTIQNLEESLHMQNATTSDNQGITKQKVDVVVYATQEKRWPKTPGKTTRLEGPAGCKEHFETPNHKDEPIGDDKTKIPCKSLQPIAENIKSSTKLRASTSGKKVDMKEGLSALTKLIHMSGETGHTAKVLECEHGDIKVLKQSENEMLAPTVTRSMRALAKAKEKVQPLEDLTGFQELFLSPVPGDKIIKMPSKSPYTEPVRTPASTKRLSKTALRKVDVTEEPSTLGKITKSPGRAAGTPEPGQEENDTAAFMETPKQKLDFTGNSTGHKRRSRKPKIRAQPLEDLDGFQELFQTPAGASDPVSVEESAKMSLESSQAEPVRTPASTKRLSKTVLSKVDVREEPSALGKRTKSPGRAAGTPEPGQEENDTTAFVETPKQKLDFTGNSTGHKRRSRTPKIRAQPLEDLDGFQELFQTPAGASDPVSVEDTVKMSLESSQAEPVRTAASTKRLSKTALSKVDVREEPSTLGKRTKSPGRAAGTPAPVQKENGTTAFMETPKQKLDFTGNSTGHKRRSRTPKIRAQPLEDLDGFQELFQTPAGASDPVSVEESAKMSLESSQAEPVRTAASTKRLSKTALSKVDVREEPSTLGKRTKSPGRARGSPAPMKEENDTTAFVETPKQKLDFTGNSTGHKRRSRTPKIRAQPLEDLDGFQELFQTPAGASDPVSVEDTVKMSLESSQAEPVRTAASTKRLSKTALSKVDVREEPSTLGKRTKSPGRAAGTPAPVQKENGTTAFMETPKQKLDFTGNSTGHKRRSRTPKIRAQPLEDLDGFQELFQTPAGASDPVSVEESAKMSLESSQAEPVRTPASTKRLSKTVLSKVDVREEPSALGKRTKSPGRAAGTPAPMKEENDTTAFVETPKQKLESAGHLTGFRKQSRTPKAKAQYLEDSTGFQELFQTPDHANGLLAVGKTKKKSFNSPQPESTITLESIERQSRASMSEKDVKEELLESEEHLQLGEGIDTLQVPNNNKVIRSCRKPAKRKLDPTASVPGSKRMRCSSKDNTPCLEDLSGFQQLFQTPGCAKDSLTIETSTMLTGLQSGPVRIQINRKSLPTISLRKVDVTKEPSVLQKQSPSRAPTATVQEDNGIEAIMETSKETLQTAADITRLTRRSQTPKEKVQPLEDHGGFQELFQTPLYSTDPLIGNKRTRMSLKSPQPGFVKTPQTSKRQAKTSVGNIAVREMLSPANMPRRSTGEVSYIPIGPEEDDQGNKGVKESTPQTLGSSASRIVSKKQQGTHEEKSQFSGDLFYLQELFQTPASGKEPMTVGETTKIAFQSPQPGHIKTPASTKRLSKTSLTKVDVRELPILEKQTQSRGRAKCTPTPMQEEDTTAFMETQKQKLDFIGNSTGHKRWSRTPKIRAQPLEDLDGFQELFQTPAGARDPVSVEESTKMSLESSQAEPVRTPASTKRLSKTALSKVDVREEPSTPGKRTKSPGRAAGTPAPMKEENGTTAFMETPKQKLDFTGNSTGHKRRSRTPKIRAQPLEDLDGFQELFQTPAGARDPVSVEESAKMSLESSQAEPVRTPASTKRLSKTALSKVDVREEPSTLGKITKSPGRAAGTPAPMKEENGTTAFMETPKQKLDFTGNSTGHKRRSRTPKIRAQPLEDLDGFQELFQTPAGASDPVSVEDTVKMSLESSQAEPVRTAASTKRLSKTGLSKVDVREEPSTLGKRTKSPGRAAGTPAPVQKENGTTAFMETPKQRLDFAENSAESKKRSRTPKIRAQPLDDLDDFQELFQTPAGASDPVNVEECAKISLEFSQAEPVRTPASTKRLSKTALRKVDVRGTLSPPSKPSYASQKVTPTLPKDHGSETKNVKVFLAQTLDSAVHVTRGKRQQGSYKKRSQSPEDLFGLQELLQTSGHYKDSVALDSLAKLPGRTPSPEPIDISVTSQRQPRTGLRKVRVKNELSGDIMHPQMSGEIVDLSREPEGEDKVIKTRKQSVKRKLDIAVNVPGSKRQRLKRAEKTLEDLPGSQELCQAPSLVMDSVIVDQTSEMLSKSPEPVDTTSETQPRSRLRRLGVTEEPIPQRKTTRVLRRTRNTHEEPLSDSKGIKELKESSAQKQAPAVSLTVRRNQPRTVKEKPQPLGELTSFQEETATRMSSKSPPPEEKKTLADLNRQLRIRLFKVGIKEEPIAQRKQPSRETRSTLTEPMGDSINVEELKKSTKQKIDPVANVPVSKRPRRVPKEKAQTLELAGLKGLIQTLGHTEESASNKGPTQMPCNSLQPEQVGSLQTSPRRLRIRHGKVEADKELSAVRKTVPTSRQTMQSCKVPEIDDSGTQASKASIKQTLDKVAKVTGSRRQLRTHKDRVQPLEVLGDSKEITQVSDHSEKLTHDTSILKSTLQQKPDPAKPLRTSRRVLRASKEDPKEVLVDARDAAALQSKSNPFLSPKGRSARDRSILRTRALRSETTKQEATDEKPVPKKQRAASSKRHVSPEPVKMKHVRIVSNKHESVEEQVSTIMKTEEMEAKRKNPVTPDQKTPQSSRYRKKTNEKQPRSKFDASAEKVGIEKNEKTMKTASQETELQNPDDGAKKSTSQGKISGKRTCLRSRRQTETPQPREAEEKTSKSGVETLIKTQKEKGVSGESDVRCLRSRKTRVSLDSEPKPRVTRGTKKDAKTLKKDEDIVYTKKLRTRSHQKNEAM